MKDDRLQEELLLLLYDEVDEATRERLERHLESCAESRQLLEDHRGVLAFDREHQRAIQLPRFQKRSHPWIPLVAAALLLLSVGLWSARPSQPTETAPVASMEFDPFEPIALKLPERSSLWSQGKAEMSVKQRLARLQREPLL